MYKSTVMNYSILYWPFWAWFRYLSFVILCRYLLSTPRMDIYMLLMLTTDPRPVIGPQAASAQPMSGRDGDEMRRPRRRHQMTPGLES